MKNFWLSWYATEKTGPWTLHSPWWISGARIVADRLAFDEEREEPTICAAVQAVDADAAREIILAAHDDRPDGKIEWRFCEERPADWLPFSDRFPRGDWMQWPVADHGQR